MNDLRYAFRKLRRNAGFALVAVLTLGLGIGATTALFTVVNGVLLRDLPYPDPDRLVVLSSASPQRGVDRGTVSVLDFRDWSEQTRTVARMGLFSTLPSDLVLLAEDGARELQTAHVSWGFFPTLGVDPLVGRVFRPEDETGDARVVVLSHGFWTQEYGADPPLREAIVGNVRRALLVLFGAVAFVLLIACVNVANLLLARGTGRQRQMAVRAAAGAGRGRIVRMLLAESLVLGLLGAVVGCVLAFWGVDLLLRRSAGLIPRAHEVAPDARVLAFALVTALLTTVVFGLFPAVATARSDPAKDLKEGGGDRGATRLRARGGLVAAEVAIAMVLLVGAGLLIRSFWSLRNVDPGFRAEGALAVTLVIPSSRYLERERYLAAHDQILDGLRAIPGVEAVGSIRNLPMRGAGESWSWEVAGQPDVPLAQRPTADVIQVTPDLFQALGVPLLTAGR